MRVTFASATLPIAIVPRVIALLAVAWLVSTTGPAAQADEATAAAGMIIDTGEGEPISVVVTFAGEEITALDALRRAELNAVTVEFGGLGEAVCEIADTGCDVSACRQRVCQSGDPESPFWQYWEQGEDGWRLSQRGASHATLADGEIAAWVWTGPAPALEPVEWATLADAAGAPAPVVAGEIAGATAVYRSGDAPAGEDVDATDTVMAAGVVVLVAVAGGWLVMRQRRGRAEAA